MASFFATKLQQPDTDEDSSDDSEYVPDEDELDDDEDESLEREEDEDGGMEGADAGSRRYGSVKKRRGSRAKPELASAGPHRVRRGGIQLEGDADEAPAQPQPDPPLTARLDEVSSVNVKNEREKRRADVLWASFLSDVGPASVVKGTSSSVAIATVAKSTDAAGDGSSTTATSSAACEQHQPVRTRIFDFAGESISVPLTSPSTSASITSAATKRPAAAGGGGGVRGLLDRLTKRPKLSTLEKSRLDWESFKSAEGIGDDLATHNRGKAGYLERQAFLERADYRRYELERDARLASGGSGGQAGGKS